MLVSLCSAPTRFPTLLFLLILSHRQPPHLIFPETLLLGGGCSLEEGGPTEIVRSERQHLPESQAPLVKGQPPTFLMFRWSARRGQGPGFLSSL